MRGLFIAAATATAANAALMTWYLHSQDAKRYRRFNKFDWRNAVVGSTMAVMGDVVCLAPLLTGTAAALS